MKITVIGTGYAGLVTGVCLSDVGIEVTGVDINHAILFVDEDRAVCATLEKVSNQYGQEYDLAWPKAAIKTTTPYQSAQSVKKGFALIDGLGDKIQSSS